MPKKGGKKKGKKSSGDSEKRPLTLAGDMEDYAKVMKCLGDRRLTVILPDSSEMLALIPGRFRKRVWMGPGDIVLVSRREFQDGKLDIVHKYHSDEVRKLHKKGAIPGFFMEVEATQDIDDGCGIVIGNVDEENSGSEDELDFENL